MSDRSTVIVPNSQFISQNVRNVTMGNALGVVSITLTLPLETDANRCVSCCWRLTMSMRRFWMRRPPRCRSRT
jgi:hypothetical protein